MKSKKKAKLKKMLLNRRSLISAPPTVPFVNKKAYKREKTIELE